MSSFIVSDKTINRILTFIETRGFNDSISSIEMENLFKKNSIDINSIEGLNSFGTSLLFMNTKAVNYRYDEKTFIDEHKFKAEVSNIYQVLKSLHCLLYQCNEGKISRMRLYKLMERFSELIKNHIINNLPEYEFAKWD